MTELGMWLINGAGIALQWSAACCLFPAVALACLAWAINRMPVRVRPPPRPPSRPQFKAGAVRADREREADKAAPGDRGSDRGGPT